MAFLYTVACFCIRSQFGRGCICIHFEHQKRHGSTAVHDQGWRKSEKQRQERALSVTQFHNPKARAASNEQRGGKRTGHLDCDFRRTVKTCFARQKRGSAAAEAAHNAAWRLMAIALLAFEKLDIDFDIIS